MKEFFLKIKAWLQKLSFKSGVIVLLCCIPLYLISFGVFLLPISKATKGILWALFFGLAKTAQYGGLTILGAEGIKRFKNWFKSRKERN